MGERDKVETKDVSSLKNPFAKADISQQGQASSRFFDEFRASGSFHGNSINTTAIGDAHEKTEVKAAMPADNTESIHGQSLVAKAVLGFLDRFDYNPGGPLAVGILTGVVMPGKLIVKLGVGAAMTVGQYEAEKFLHINKWEK
jgi:hypothetical protein